MSGVPGADLEEALQREHPGYEPRPEQARMARDLGECFEHGGILLAEAPTGLGKTLAYLLPAAEWARRSGQPVVVATHTRSLQDQILESEWPIVARALDGDARIARLKGRENYLCRSRVDAYLAENAGTADAETLRELLEAIPEGDVSALGEGSGSFDFFRGADLDAGNCPGEICRNTRGCWLRQARRKAQEAHVVVVNHALWLSDRMGGGGGVLPDFSRLVVDEAHHLPEAFARALSTRFTEHGFMQALDRLVGRGRGGALLRNYERSRKGLPMFDSQPQLAAAGELARSLEHVRTLAESAFSRMSETLSAKGRIRIDVATDPTEFFPPALDDLLDGLREAIRLFGTLREHPPGEEEKEALGMWPHLLRALGRWELSARALLELTGATLPGRCSTLEWQKQTGVAMESVPWDVGGEARMELTTHLESVVLTSATLSANGTFEYLCDRLGLGPDMARGERYRSTLDPAEQLLAMCVGSMPDPRSPGYLEEAAEVVAALSRLGRNTLVLATSWDALRTLDRLLSSRVKSLLVQADPRGRTRLSQQFRNTRGAVLLGVASFWEGMDFPGEELEVLVMLKLPFGSPADPIFEARRADLEARGEDAFRKISLPEAILRFRQGLGRLLRRSTDRGVFVLLDRRALQSSYGKGFAEAIGSPLRTASNPGQAFELAREFLGEM